MTTPFDGVRVLDLTDRLSGAFAARLFGDFGAEVILAEPPAGHALRHEPPFMDDKAGLDRGTLHAYANWNKQSVVIDDLAALQALMSSVDVIVTTADPLANAPYASCLSELSPVVVHLSITPHGLNDPLSGRPGNNLTASARTGWSFVNGYRDEPPLQMPHNQAGYVGGVTGFIAAAAALRRRDHGSEPELVDVSEVEAFALTLHTWAIAAVYADRGFSFAAAGGRPRGRPGPLWDLADGRMNFGVGDFHNWPEAMQAVGLPEFAVREELIQDIGRHSKDLREVYSAMAESLPRLDRWPVFHEMARLRCVAGVMQDIDDVLKNEQMIAREFIVETTIEDRRVRVAGAPANLAPSPWRLTRPAPHLGEHDEDVKSRRQVPASPLTGQLSEESLAEGPLSGIRVLSFGQAWSGTFATEVLALLGADVVQIGSLHRPDVFRRLSNQVPAGVLDPSRTQHPLNTQGHYNSVNLHKREVTLDLRQDRGLELLLQLLPGYDVVADNFRPTVIPSWGLSLEKMNELRPGIIWASISGYGESGPYREYPANGSTTEPMSGLSSIHGYPGDPGMNTGGLYPDPVSGYFLVATIVAALAHRDRTGEPQRIDLSMMEAIAAVCGDAIVEYDATGRLPGPRGNFHPRIAPHNNYPARDDEWLALAAETEAAWQALVDHIADPRLREEKFATMESRKANESALDQIIGEWSSAQDAGEVEHELGTLGITVARVKNYYQIYSQPDPDFKASGFIGEVNHPEAGSTWLPGRPWRYSAAPASPVRPAPCVGQHSREILVEELGVSASDYEALVAAGVTGTLDDLKKR